MSSYKYETDFIIVYPRIENDTIQEYKICRTPDIAKFLGNIVILTRNCIFNGYTSSGDLSTMVFMAGIVLASGRGIPKFFNRGKLPTNRKVADSYAINQIKIFFCRFHKIKVDTIDLMDLSMQINFKDGSNALLAFNDNKNLQGLNRGCLIDIENGSETVMKAFDYTPPKKEE